MSNDNDSMPSPIGTSADSDTSYLTFKPGQRLKKARELRGLSVEQASRDLGISIRYINAIEADDYSQLPEATFVRGYMRRYAQLVNLSADDIVAKFDASFSEEKAKGALPEPMPNPIKILGSFSRPKLPWRRIFSVLSMLLIGALIIGALFWKGFGSSEPVVAFDPAVDAQVSENETDGRVIVPLSVPTVEAAPAADVLLPVPQTAAALPEPVSVPSTPAVTPTTLPLTASAPTAVTTPAPTQSVPAAAIPASTPVATPAPVIPPVETGADSLEFGFSGESWVSVSDAAGRVIFSGIKNAGDRLALNGHAPFNVTVGNAPVTTLKFNTAPVDLASRTRGSSTAKLTLGR